MKVWLPSVIWLFQMNGITMIADMLKKRFRAEPRISTTLMPDARFWPHDAAILDNVWLHIATSCTRTS